MSKKETERRLKLTRAFAHRIAAAKEREGAKDAGEWKRKVKEHDEALGRPLS